MELSIAIRLIEKGIPKSNSPQYWVDLGAGDGFFTRALGSVLPSNSSILAIDQNANALKSIKWDFKSVSLQTLSGNFVSMDLDGNIDGILMANALHYVSAQTDFLLALRIKLSPIGRLVIVEYERTKSNAWVPYPIGFRKLLEAGEATGFTSIIKVEEAPSTYDSATIYSAILSL
ncbi:MAG: class I SAM-dependent methyltransferase [Bacteroidetes bacterium]|nr:class I SAM-dependent methyltransferase [Bacteroidota bacterium]MBI3483287.1 class I SAM-dependent methyltransferase [Bacteroidota bacterium]